MSKLVVDLSGIKSLMNDTYYPLLEEKTKVFMIKGGAGSGKSYFAADKILWRILGEQNIRVLVLRKVNAANRHSTFALLKSEIKRWGLWHLAHVRETDMHISFPKFNSEIIFGGMKGEDERERIKSVTDISMIWMEEMTQFDYHDYTQLLLRLRGKTGHYLQILGIFNPISIHHWIKTRLVDAKKDHVKLITTTYKDNRFLDDEYIENLLSQFERDPNMKRIYVDGDWGLVNQGQEAYTGFKDELVGDFEYRPDLPLHLSFDFNVQPYMTCTIYQLLPKEDISTSDNKIRVRMIDEICAEHPYNSTEGICELLKQRYGYHSQGMIIYGDPSGYRRDTREQIGDRSNDYAIIVNSLQRFKTNIRVLKKAPQVSPRIEWMNQIMEGNTVFDLKFDRKCFHTIEDMMYVKRAADGGKVKTKVIHEETGERIERYGHTSDSLEYFMTQCFYDQWCAYNSTGNAYMGVKAHKRPQKYIY